MHPSSISRQAVLGSSPTGRECTAVLPTILIGNREGHLTILERIREIPNTLRANVRRLLNRGRQFDALMRYARWQDPYDRPASKLRRHSTSSGTRSEEQIGGIESLPDEHDR